MFMFWVFGIFLVSNIKYEYGQILNEWGALFCNFLHLPPPSETRIHEPIHDFFFHINSLIMRLIMERDSLL